MVSTYVPEKCVTQEQLVPFTFVDTSARKMPILKLYFMARPDPVRYFGHGARSMTQDELKHYLKNRRIKPTT